MSDPRPAHLLGATGTGLALTPALRVLTWPLLGLTLLVLGRAWYLQLNHGGSSVWRRRAAVTLALSTLLSVTLWTLRFAGLLGMSPL